ncbi:MAG TPA: diacylglycerol kinase family protein [Ktedonobacteraceae bacterium]|nr:diacylglycerol kinase family protein [Ktedonobacteraceae bacterium]
MHHQRVCLIINPRDGKNLSKLTAILAVFAAANWHTNIVLKEYGGHTTELATDAAQQGYDQVIAYGGDGTLNQVVNGLMNGKKRNSVVGTLPGGTVNQWAAEVGIPEDPVKAALALVSSNVRKVDVARVDVTMLTFLSSTEKEHLTSLVDTHDKKVESEKGKTSSGAKHHFLMMAGLGIDAAIMARVNKNLKHHIGVAAVGITATEQLPEQRAFPVEVRVIEKERNTEQVWKGEALQIVIGNTRRYANTVEMTADASIDDGMLDACVITAGDPLSTVQQIASFLFRRKPDNRTTEFFRGVQLSICVPASIALQLDGSTVRLKDYLCKSDRKALQNAEDMEHIRVTYHFEAIPRALQAAIPRTYAGPLFEKSDHDEASHPAQKDTHNASSSQTAPSSTGEQRQSGEDVNTLIEQGCKVTVVGVTEHPDKKQAYIVAGTTSKKSTGETTPVAICIDDHTMLLKQTGELAAAVDVEHLQESAEIVVDGKKSKRGVIHAMHVVI